MKIKTFFLGICVLVGVLSALPVFGQVMVETVDPNAPGNLTSSSDKPEYVQAVSTDGGVGANDPRASNFQLIPCTGVKKADGTGVECDFNQLIVAANRIIKFLFYLAIPLVLGMILYTGWLYLTANGDAGQLEKAKKMFIPVLLGMFWIGASYIVVYTIIDKFVSKDAGNATKDAIKFLGNTK